MAGEGSGGGSLNHLDGAGYRRIGIRFTRVVIVDTLEQKMADSREVGATLPGFRVFALRVVAGHHQGAVLPLERGRSFTLGRGSDADVVLDDELVSRSHLSIKWEEDVPILEDSGSTNGTFVNGMRIQKWRLAPGDRIAVGGSLLKVVAEFVPVSLADAHRFMKDQGSDDGKAVLEGTLDEIPLPEIVQLLGVTKKSGVLLLNRDDDRAEIHIDRGRVLHCALTGHANVVGLKAFVRILAWRGGRFRLDPPAAHPPPVSPPERLESVLMEACRHLDEIARLEKEIPLTTVLARVAPAPTPVDTLAPGDQKLLELLSPSSTVETLLDRTPLPDLEVLEHLRSLELTGLVRRSG
jgi:pSer/pThr/pTyr-binding forkhead associated (FHA) protein